MNPTPPLLHESALHSSRASVDKSHSLLETNHSRIASQMSEEVKEKRQIDKFREAARELETDDSEEAFDAKLKKIAKAPPPKEAKPSK